MLTGRAGQLRERASHPHRRERRRACWIFARLAGRRRAFASRGCDRFSSGSRAGKSRCAGPPATPVQDRGDGPRQHELTSIGAAQLLRSRPAEALAVQHVLQFRAGPTSIRHGEISSRCYCTWRNRSAVAVRSWPLVAGLAPAAGNRTRTRNRSVDRLINKVASPTTTGWKITCAIRANHS